MTKLYNRKHIKEKRRELRQNETYAEKCIWSQLRNRSFLGLKFKRQFSIDRYIIDFYCPEHKIAIEVDGSVHDMEEVKTNDKQRQTILESYGVKFIRVTNEEYFGNPNKAFDRIERELKDLIESG